MEVIFSIIILIFSVILHEMAHGYSAVWLGDPTPRLHNRLSLNPRYHLDPLGSIILPLISYFAGGFILGWAKPVLVNTYNLRFGKWGEAIVAIAGPLSNILLAAIFSFLIRFADILSLSTAFVEISASIVLINLVLAVFNLFPVPPLDGSKILFAFLPYHLQYIRNVLEQYSLVLIVFFILFAWKVVQPIVLFLFALFTGIQ